MDMYIRYKIIVEKYEFNDLVLPKCKKTALCNLTLLIISKICHAFTIHLLPNGQFNSVYIIFLILVR